MPSLRFFVSPAIATCALLGLAGCGSSAQGSATFNEPKYGFAAKSVLYAQMPASASGADPNGKVPSGTALGVFLFSQADACDSLSSDPNRAALSGPTQAYPWAGLIALSGNGNAPMPLGAYAFSTGSIDDDLLGVPAADAAGTMQASIYTANDGILEAQTGSTLTLGRIDANLSDGKASGTFSFAFGSSGSFSATYCKNVLPLLAGWVATDLPQQDDSDPDLPVDAKPAKG